MKSKRKVRLSFIISIISLFFLTVISSFILIISLKPLKINLLDYFDRESKIFKKIKVEEIGDIFLSFNKVTKNFELLIEDLVYEDSYFPNILITLDPTFDKQILNKSLKIFDGDIKIILPGKPQNKEDNSLTIERLKSNFELRFHLYFYTHHKYHLNPHFPFHFYLYLQSLSVKPAPAAPCFKLSVSSTKVSSESL